MGSRFRGGGHLSLRFERLIWKWAYRSFWKRKYRGRNRGSDISLKEYQDAIQERENNYIMNFGRQPGDRERPLLQQQAWEYLIAQKAIKPEFERVGIKVSTDEIWDMIQGKTLMKV